MNRRFFTLCGLGLAVITGCADETRDMPRLSAHFPLNEGAGIHVTDVVGGTTGTIQAAHTPIAWTAGKVGGALAFNGQDGVTEIPHDAAFDFGDEDFSVSFLMRWPRGLEPHHERILTKGDYMTTPEFPHETGKRWEFFMPPEGLCWLVDDDVHKSQVQVDFDAFTTGDWVHVVGVRDTQKDELRLYANGVLQRSNDPTNPEFDGVDRSGSISNPQSLFIGVSSRLDNPFEGTLDDIRIFRGALNMEQIAAIAPSANAGASTSTSDAGRPRIIVTSDGEIDDQCSMIRFLLYANEWDIEGIITSSSQYHWQGHKWAGDDWIQPDLDAYEKVYPNLLKHEPGYPTPAYLRSITLLGNVKAEGDMAEPTPGSDLIVEVLLDETDDRPVWLQAWGGVNTIARALKTIEDEHPDKMAYVASKIRLYLIWEQDKTYQDYIKPNWGKYGILTIISDQFISYFYHWKKYLPAHEKSYLIGTWMNEHIIQGHGPLTAEYKAHVEGANPRFDDGDFRSEGDSPAFLHNILTGLRSMESPEWGGWGGRYVNIRANEWLDPVLEPGYEYPEGRWYTGSAWGRQRLRQNIPDDAELTAYLKPTWRWIEALQNDFASRADWCVKPYAEANHPPVVKLDHGLDLKAVPGDAVHLSAVQSHDPDGDELSYHWWQYGEADTYAGVVEIETSTTASASFAIPADARPGDSIHVVCEVTDTGTPALTRYRRVVITVK